MCVDLSRPDFRYVVTSVKVLNDVEKSHLGIYDEDNIYIFVTLDHLTGIWFNIKYLTNMGKELDDWRDYKIISIRDNKVLLRLVSLRPDIDYLAINIGDSFHNMNFPIG